MRTIALIVLLVCLASTSWGAPCDQAPAQAKTCSRRVVRLCIPPASGPVAGYRVGLTGPYGATTVDVPDVGDALIRVPTTIGNPHTFKVWALDADGNVGPDSPASVPNYAFGDVDLNGNGLVNTGDRIPTAAAYCTLRAIP